MSIRSTHCLTCGPSSPRAKATRRPWKPEMPEAGSTVKVRTFSGVLGGDLLDVHAALGRADEGDARGDAVDEQREVELARDVGAVLDVDAVDLLAGGAGLLGDEGAAQHLPGLVGGVLDRLGHADAALVAGRGFLELPLPRPPAWIWALTTQMGPSISLAAVLASSAFSTTRPSETGAPYSAGAAWPGIRECSSPPSLAVAGRVDQPRAGLGLGYARSAACKRIAQGISLRGKRAL